MLALQGTRALAREGRKLSAMVKGKAARVRARSRSVGKTVRAISRTLSRRTGQAKDQVIELNSRAGAKIARSAREARGLAAQARKAAGGRGAQASCAPPPSSKSWPAAARRSATRSTGVPAD